MTLSPLPDGLTTRPPIGPADPAGHRSDVDAVTALLRADEAAAGADPHTSAEDIRGDWARPSIDLERDAICIHDGDTLVGYADQHAGRAYVGVDPAAHGRGIGAWLLAWTEAHARGRGEPRVGQTLVDGDPAEALLRARGYDARWTSWLFSTPLAPPLDDPVLPEGAVLRPMARPAEEAVVHRVVEDAFAEWPDRDTGTSLEDWRAAVLDRGDVEVLVIDAAPDGIVGVAVLIDEGDGEGWVDQLAVARAHRGRGLGRALLQGAFTRFAERGCTTAGLSTDSRTGARALYEHVGMAVHESYTRWSRDLG